MSHYSYVVPRARLSRLRHSSVFFYSLCSTSLGDMTSPPPPDGLPPPGSIPRTPWMTRTTCWSMTRGWVTPGKTPTPPPRSPTSRCHVPPHPHQPSPPRAFPVRPVRYDTSDPAAAERARALNDVWNSPLREHPSVAGLGEETPEVVEGEWGRGPAYPSQHSHRPHPRLPKNPPPTPTRAKHLRHPRA